MARTVPIRQFRAELASLLDGVQRRRDHLTITRNGAAAAVVVPVDEYASLEETAEILADPETVEAIETGVAEAKRGELVELEEVRAELDARRRL